MYERFDKRQALPFEGMNSIDDSTFNYLIFKYTLLN
jgi:hypothetical protein